MPGPLVPPPTVPLVPPPTVPLVPPPTVLVLVLGWMWLI